VGGGAEVVEACVVGDEVVGGVVLGRVVVTAGLVGLVRGGSVVEVAGV
jgi:hypothetical protein